MKSIREQQTIPREVRKYMTDEELVERLLDWPYQGETMAQEAADRIEQLTAERDKAYASGYSDAETEISKSALGQDNTFLHSQYTNAKLRIEALTAERDELRKLLDVIVDEYEIEFGFTMLSIDAARDVLNKKL